MTSNSIKLHNFAMPKALPLEGRALTESTVRNMLTAIEAPLYDIGVLSERGMLPGLNGMLATPVPDRLSLLKHRNAHGSHAHQYPHWLRRHLHKDILYLKTYCM
jgi:hypothetical protein